MALGKLGKLFGSDELAAGPAGGRHVNQELIEILEEVVYQAKLSDTFLFSGWEGVDDALADLLPILEGVEKNEKKAIKKLDVLFEPKGSLQELATDNGWLEDFEKLADRFDAFMEALESGTKQQADTVKRQPAQVTPQPEPQSLPERKSETIQVKKQEKKPEPKVILESDKKPTSDRDRGPGSKVYRYYAD